MYVCTYVHTSMLIFLLNKSKFLFELKEMFLITFRNLTPAFVVALDLIYYCFTQHIVSRNLSILCTLYIIHCTISSSYLKTFCKSRTQTSYSLSSQPKLIIPIFIIFMYYYVFHTTITIKPIFTKRKISVTSTELIKT